MDRPLWILSRTRQASIRIPTRVSDGSRSKKENPEGNSRRSTESIQDFITTLSYGADEMGGAKAKCLVTGDARRHFKILINILRYLILFPLGKQDL
jgi:hypothetical protein